MKTLKIIMALAVISIVMSASVCLADHTYVVEGYVFEKATGKPIPGAHMRWYFAGDTAAIKDTDENGFYQFEIDVMQYPTPIPANFGLNIVAVVNFGKPDPIYASDIFIPYPPVEGHVYQRNLYLEIPEEYSDDIHYDIKNAVSDVNSNILYTQDTINTRIYDYLKRIYSLLRYRWWSSRP